MISSPGQIASTNSLAGTAQQSSSAASSTSEIIASFKEIMAVMMASSSMPSSGEQIGSGMSQMMMAPLMLLLLEKLVEGQLEQHGAPSTAAEASSGVRSEADVTDASQGASPEPSGRPVTGRLTQEYHRGHNGLDIAVPVGTSIKTTMDGRVVHAGWNNQGYGNLVIVENGAYRTYYAHLSSIPVSIGDTVQAGATIGLSGNTGNSTGPHLHYEIRRNLVPIDPTSATFGTGS
jgi:murein DD-endopeptidase MepM/ murein hydrolase activator NlpD